jgi:hypothetical protein
MTRISDVIDLCENSFGFQADAEAMREVYTLIHVNQKSICLFLAKKDFSLRDIEEEMKVLSVRP